jgi:hypothetical protein
MLAAVSFSSSSASNLASAATLLMVFSRDFLAASSSSFGMPSTLTRRASISALAAVRTFSRSPQFLSFWAPASPRLRSSRRFFSANSSASSLRWRSIS